MKRKNSEISTCDFSLPALQERQHALEAKRHEIIAKVLDAAPQLLQNLIDLALSEGDVRAYRLLFEIAGLAGKSSSVNILQQFNMQDLVSKQLEALVHELNREDRIWEDGSHA